MRIQTNHSLYKIILFVLLFSASAKAQIQRTEPPFWYAGMNNPELQIMFYGKNISQYEASVSNNVTIKDIKKTENPNYVFVTIDTKDIPASEFVFSFKNKNKVAFTQKYSLKKRRENSAQRKSYDASDVMYLIMPDRFANGNPANDNDKSVVEKTNRPSANGRHGGDIEGIIKNLDYISSLGATTIWSTPLCEDNDLNHSYHGYAQSDVYKIDPRYGTNEDYVRLSAEMHKKNMKLVMDYVTNHWGIEHWMIKDLPTYDWIHQFPGYAQTNYRMTTQFDPNASKIDTKICMDGWFVKSMPDLNQSNPLVLNYLTQNAIWWIEYANLDGFRVDTYSYNDKAGIAKWTKAITDEYPNFNIVGEVWMHDQAQMAYWQKDSKISAIQNYNSNLPSVMDFTLHDALSSVFNEDNATWNDGMIKVYDNFTNDFLYPNTNNLLTFVENHDTGRFNEIYKNDFKKYQMAMTILPQPEEFHSCITVVKLEWQEIKAKATARSDKISLVDGKGTLIMLLQKKAEQQNKAKYFDFTSKLFNWRKTNDAVHFGKMTHYLPENNVYAYFRYNDSKTVMVVVNNSATNQTIKTNRFQENIKNYKTGKDVLSGKKFDLTAEITLEGKSAIVLELE